MPQDPAGSDAKKLYSALHPARRSPSKSPLEALVLRIGSIATLYVKLTSKHRVGVPLALHIVLLALSRPEARGVVSPSLQARPQGPMRALYAAREHRGPIVAPGELQGSLCPSSKPWGASPSYM
jgi:hypothetical protein